MWTTVQTVERVPRSQAVGAILGRVADPFDEARMFADMNRRVQEKFAAYIRTADEAEARALRMGRTGMPPADIASELGLEVEQVEIWQFALGWIGLGFPPELAKVRAKSGLLRKRDPATTEAFESLMQRTFVPVLKAAGYRKTRYTWQRPGEEVSPRVDIQRGHSSGDLLTFTSNWSLTVPGFDERLTAFSTDPNPDGVARGRIGEFLPRSADTWWSVQLGWFAREPPDVIDDPEAVEAEIKLGLRRMLSFLDEIDSIDALIEIVELDVHAHRPDRTISALRSLQADQADRRPT